MIHRYGIQLLLLYRKQEVKIVFYSTFPITLKINCIYVLSVCSSCNRVSPEVMGSFNFFFSHPPPPPPPPPLEASTKTCWAPLLPPSADVT